jgi:integrase/recombinase XerD
LLPHRYHRRAPYLYTDEETERILAAAPALPPASGLRRWTCFTLIGLLSVTGPRPGEAVKLELEDVDWKACVLTVRGSKFGKSRWVPIHSSTRDALAEYLRRRGRCLAGRPETHLFGDETIADAMLDRLVQRHHRITLTGDSLRKGLPKPNILEPELDQN